MSEKSETKMPKFITDLGDNKYEIKCKHETYILEEKKAKIFESCVKLSEKLDISVEKLLTMRSMIEPKISDDEFDEIMGSDYIKLQVAVKYIYGLNDFLQEEE